MLTTRRSKLEGLRPDQVLLLIIGGGGDDDDDDDDNNNNNSNNYQEVSECLPCTRHRLTLLYLIIEEIPLLGITVVLDPTISYLPLKGKKEAGGIVQ